MRSGRSSIRPLCRCRLAFSARSWARSWLGGTRTTSRASMRFRFVFTPASPPSSGDLPRAASQVVIILERGNLMAIRGLVFDAYGTLYDVQSVRTMAVELCGEKGELVTQLWRLKQLEYTWLRGLMQSYEDFWSVTRASLEFSLASVGLTPSPSLCEPLMQKYLDLDLYPEAREALSSL